MKTFKVGEQIVLGIYAKSSLMNKIDEKDFKLYLAKAKKPKDETEVNAKVINDEPYWWTTPFLIFEEGLYIFHWKNDDADINVKELIKIEGEIDKGNSKILA